MSERPQRTVLIIGRSGSGKSTLTARLTKGLKVPVHVVNDRANAKGYVQTSWEEAKTLSNACLVFEDVIGASKKEFKILQGVLAFSNHHLLLNPIFIVAHAIYCNNIHGLLSYVTEVIITACRGNVSSLIATLNYFRFDKEERSCFLSRFLSSCLPYTHFVLDVEKRTLKHVSSDASVESSSVDPLAALSMSEASGAANRFLALLPESGKALAIFDLIKTKVSSKWIDSDDLTITLHNARGASVRISLIDYLFALTTPDAEPSRDVALLHRYISRKVLLPAAFILNPRLS